MGWTLAAGDKMVASRAGRSAVSSEQPPVPSEQVRLESAGSSLAKPTPTQYAFKKQPYLSLSSGKQSPLAGFACVGQESMIAAIRHTSSWIVAGTGRATLPALQYRCAGRAGNLLSSCLGWKNLRKAHQPVVTDGRRCSGARTDAPSGEIRVRSTHCFHVLLPRAAHVWQGPNAGARGEPSQQLRPACFRLWPAATSVCRVGSRAWPFPAARVSEGLRRRPRT